MSQKILLDTDIGTDIDDFVCLAYLLAEPDCELMGITTVTGEAHKRAQMASVLCKIAGREDLPIFPGVEDPFLVAPRQVQASQAEKLPNWSYRESFPEGEAIAFLRDTIRAHPGEITLLAIGPYTNVGLLFTQYPDIPGLLKSLVVMGGVFTRCLPDGPYDNAAALREWNAMLDPHATAMIYKPDVAIHRSVGLDVTLKVYMPSSEVQKKFTHPLLEAVSDFAEVFFRHRNEITFHDPLAAVSLFDDEVLEYDEGAVHVELASPRLMGMTEFDRHADPARHEIAKSVDIDRFFERYFSVFK